MHQTPPLPPAILLMGPTASGKTACALTLARHLPVEIISVDSALVYRDMDIGTAKPSAAEQAICPHHLIDIISPEEAYSAARFCADARRLMGEISARGRIPLLVGGTMLYYKALRDGLSDLPEADPTLRREIEDAAALEGWPALHDELARLDPDAAARLEPNDAQRIQRALEIVRLTGRPLAASYAQRESSVDTHRLIPIGLTPGERAILHARIEKRFDAMLLAGFVDEVETLRRHYRLDASLPSMRCVGYRQALEYLEGRCSLATFRDKGIFATRQLAKRQITWQRNFRERWGDIQELDCLNPELEKQVLESVCARLPAV
ncbi:tRNA (adenosine(37)-N6)-dimethylallyltransferase MiaA [Zoogloea sp.]|uniref:tRNA (adenosine(37)-N6)-dimethylallyltransferase MiaA n=1 Tax=Zoogloea sp. TaxID=49181 RepID=UPI00321F6512